MTSLRTQLLKRELSKKQLEDQNNDDIEDLAFEKLKEQAESEIKTNLVRLMYRAKYNLPPNDPRFLNMTDEELLYELVLQNEYSKYIDNRAELPEGKSKEIFESDKKQFDDVVKKLENGDDVDLLSLLPKQHWEKI